MYTLPPLPFPYGALEPMVDEQTMRVHHSGHHRSYVEKLNEIFKPYADLERPIEELMAGIETLPLEIQTPVRQNGGGHANHSLFWTLLAREPKKAPTGDLLRKIKNVFSSTEDFKEKFTTAAARHFSNGWAWLVSDTSGNLKICTTHDHDTPVSFGEYPLLVLDLWEHAYYLKHQNRRPEYIDAFWDVLDWSQVQTRWDRWVDEEHLAKTA